MRRNLRRFLGLLWVAGIASVILFPGLILDMWMILALVVLGIAAVMLGEGGAREQGTGWGIDWSSDGGDGDGGGNGGGE